MAFLFGAHGKKVDVCPIENGGTGANTEAAAIDNLWSAIATKIRSTFGFNSSNILPIGNGGTGASTVAAARNNLGLGNTNGALPLANGGTGKTGSTTNLTVRSASGASGTVAVTKIGSLCILEIDITISYDPSGVMIATGIPSGCIPTIGNQYCVGRTEDMVNINSSGNVTLTASSGTSSGTRTIKRIVIYAV